MYQKPGLPATGFAGAAAAPLALAEHVLSALVLTFAALALWTIYAELHHRTRDER